MLPSLDERAHGRVREGVETRAVEELRGFLGPGANAPDDRNVVIRDAWNRTTEHGGPLDGTDLSLL